MLGLAAALTVPALLAAQIVFAAPPVADFIISDNTTNVGQTVDFSSTSTDPDNDITTFEWDFNYDGSFVVNATGPNASASYDAAGSYSVALRVTDEKGGDGTVDTSLMVKTVTVSVPNTNPIADDFTWQPAGQPVGVVPDERQRVIFHGSGHDPDTPPDPITYEWDFGDGDIATGQTAAHTFDQAGSYSVSLRVRDNRGGLSDPKTKTVHVNALPVIGNAVPQAGFRVAPDPAFVGDIVTLSSTSFDPDGPLTKQEWDFDDDGQFDDANGAVVSATFARAGTHPLKLRVTDSRGATSTATGKVTVMSRRAPSPLVLPGVVVEARFLVFSTYTRIRFLRVRAPAGSTMRVRCLGKGCPKRVTKKSTGSKKLRFKKLERRFRPGTELIVSVTKSGFIGRQTSWTIRRRKAPVRRDGCLDPGAKRGSACPAG